MKDLPLVSIITPSFNQGDYLEMTMKSVLDQDYPNLEYILIDGGSTDNSQEIIKKYEKDLSYWVSEPDQGQADAINKGFRKASGEIYAWINSDDLYYPGAIIDAVRILERNSSVGLVYGDCSLINERGDVIGEYDSRQTDLKRLMKGYSDIPQPAVFFRKDIWDEAGPLDTSLFFAFDYDLWIKMSQITGLKYHPEKWACFRMHPEAKSSTSFDRCWPEMRIVHKREGGKLVSVFMGRYLLRKLFSPAWRWIKDKV